MKVCDECKMSMMDHTNCMGCEEPMCEDEDDLPENFIEGDEDEEVEYFFPVKNLTFDSKV